MSHREHNDDPLTYEHVDGMEFRDLQVKHEQTNFFQASLGATKSIKGIEKY